MHSAILNDIQYDAGLIISPSLTPLLLI